MQAITTAQDAYVIRRFVIEATMSGVERMRAVSAARLALRDAVVEHFQTGSEVEKVIHEAIDLYEREASEDRDEN